MAHPLYTAEELAFRNELQAFFIREIPERIRETVSAGLPLKKDDVVESQRILHKHGLAVPHWPEEWGGRNWSPIRRYIYLETLQRAAVPLPLQFNCFMVGPVIARFGSEEQKNRFLPRAANLDDWWCQGFSEPDAGSDLASLRTRALREGDSYVVSGQKTWTTYAQYADWIFCLVRTDPAAKKQAGISFLLIDMKSPGVTVRPIITIDGRHEVNEVFFDDVRVPVGNLVGEENRGWDYAKFLLSNERAGIARIGLSKERLARACRLAKETMWNGATLWDSPTFQSRVNTLEAELKALEFTQMRILSSETGGHVNPASSILKLKGSQLQQMASELLVGVAGPSALSHAAQPGSNEISTPSDALDLYMNFRKVSIYGGANEIQRNIIAKTILDL